MQHAPHLLAVNAEEPHGRAHLHLVNHPAPSPLLLQVFLLRGEGRGGGMQEQRQQGTRGGQLKELLHDSAIVHSLIVLDDRPEKLTCSMGRSGEPLS